MVNERIEAGEQVDLEFPAAPQRTYEPRITFHLAQLTDTQKASLRTVTHILRLLEGRVRASGSIRKAAKDLGISRTFLGAVLKGEKPPGYKLARAVGFVPKVLYMRVLNGRDTKNEDFPADFRPGMNGDE